MLSVKQLNESLRIHYVSVGGRELRRRRGKLVYPLHAARTLHLSCVPDRVVEETGGSTVEYLVSSVYPGEERGVTWYISGCHGRDIPVTFNNKVELIILLRVDTRFSYRCLDRGLF